MPSAVPSYPFLDVSKLLHCGIYCLLQKGEVIYVGKSKQPLKRLGTHMNNRNREISNNRHTHIGSSQGGPAGGPKHNGRGANFDGVWFVPCMLGQLDVIEKALITQYQPKYNQQGMPKQSIPADIKALLVEMGWQISLPPQQDSFQRFIPRRL